MTQPLMPKATAVWLIDNTALTFQQIAAFCGLHELEVQGIADGEVGVGMIGLDPIANHQLDTDEIKRCEADPSARLTPMQSGVPIPQARSKGPRYTPIAKRQDKPDAILWLLRNTPELSDAQIGKLIGTTKPTISAVRERSHWNSANIRARHPVALGMCTQFELDQALEKAGVAPGTAPTIADEPPEHEDPEAALRPLGPTERRDDPPPLDPNSLFKPRGGTGDST